MSEEERLFERTVPFIVGMLLVLLLTVLTTSCGEPHGKYMGELDGAPVYLQWGYEENMLKFDREAFEQVSKHLPDAVHHAKVPVPTNMEAVNRKHGVEIVIATQEHVERLAAQEGFNRSASPIRLGGILQTYGSDYNVIVIAFNPMDPRYWAATTYLHEYLHLVGDYRLNRLKDSSAHDIPGFWGIAAHHLPATTIEGAVYKRLNKKPFTENQRELF